jgi:hypothetical protein
MTDDTMEEFKDGYEYLIESYNDALELYNEDDVVKDSAIELLLGSASNMINQYSSVRQADYTDDEALDIIDIIWDMIYDLDSIDFVYDDDYYDDDYDDDDYDDDDYDDDYDDDDYDDGGDI